MNTRTRLSKLEAAADLQAGLCVACLRTGTCTKPEWAGSRQCGKSRDDLPDVLYPLAAAGEGTIPNNVVVYMPDNCRSPEDTLEALRRGDLTQAEREQVGAILERLREKKRQALER
jgi:hypothetical protein